jgi:hypothetical protein
LAHLASHHALPARPMRTVNFPKSAG